jgi:hypothetical protein
MPEDYFVGIYDPIDVRRNVLESSKEIVKSIQVFERVESIREEKLKTVREMKKIMAELELLVVKLSERLPKAKLRKAIRDFEPHKPIRNYASEFEKLEEQLKLVEKELAAFK